MNDPIKKEFGLYAHLRMPALKPLLPIANGILALLPRVRQSALAVRSLRIPCGDGGHVRALLMEPAGCEPCTPCLVYCHGGGFVLEAAPSHYALAAAYAKGAPCKVLFVQYRLAPKHPFPTPVHDCFSAYRYALQNAAAIGVDPARIAVGGDSAGGCLAAAVCLMARDHNVPPPRFQLLVYPVTDRRMQTASMLRFSDTPMWNTRLNAEMWRLYLPDPAADSVAYASVAEAASFAGLPDAYIETAQFDCLRDEGAAYAAALQGAGCAVELHETQGTMHGFDAAQGSPTVRACVRRRIGALRRAFE